MHYVLLFLCLFGGCSGDLFFFLVITVHYVVIAFNIIVITFVIITFIFRIRFLTKTPRLISVEN